MITITLLNWMNCHMFSTAGKLEKHITSATNESISNIKLGKQDKTLIMQKTKDDEDGTKQTVLEVGVSM